MNETKLVIELGGIWKCKTCGKVQHWQEGEEHPYCCNNLMEMGMAKRFKVEQSQGG